MSENRYMAEIDSFLSKYNVLPEQKKKIMNIFREYLYKCINISDNNVIKNSDEETIQIIRFFINKFKNKLFLLLNSNNVHNVYLDFIRVNKIDGLSFESADEEVLYDKITENKFDIEKYCLITSNYDNMCAILHSIANKLGYGEFLKSKYKDMNSNNFKGDSFSKLRKAIKNIE